MKRAALTISLFSSLLMLSGCSAVYDNVYDQQHVEWETETPEHFPVLTATGFAPIDAQPGETKQHKDLAAMRASKLAAYRELAEQVYGQRISGGTSVQNWTLGNDQFQASVDGVIRGAEVVRTYTVGEYYATELRLDFAKVNNLYESTSRKQKIKRVVYY